MLCCNLSEVIYNSFYHQFMCQTSLTNVDGHDEDEKIAKGEKLKNLFIMDIKNTLSARIVASVAAISRE